MRQTIYLDNDAEKILKEIKKYFKKNKRDLTFDESNTSKIFVEILYVFYQLFLEEGKYSSFIDRLNELHADQMEEDELRINLKQIMNEIRKLKIYSELGMYSSLATFSKVTDSTYDINTLDNISGKINDDSPQLDLIKRYIDIKD
ncbi:hypothetical protein [Enterococcus cecorum]|jgi:hypothetical protein|uniref:hypothetical protein n=1 Tax=Enterococcus cecorum TaxID=44008 RepID=UPI0032C46CCB